MTFTETIALSTRGFTDIIDITPEVAEVVRRSGMRNGMVNVFCRGSTGAVSTIEYEDGVVNDLKRAIEKVAPSGIPYEHDKRWGDGNGFSHVRAALMKPSLTVPLVNGEMALGTWQQVVFLDFDNRPRERKLIIQVLGE
jgi:secondary thiamine-phosphate synthase enzyme